MRLLFASCLVLAAVASSANAETVGEKTGVNSVLGISPTTKDFVTEAAISDMFEIQSSKLALQRSDGPTKDFAKRMVEDHEKTSAHLKQFAEKAHIPVPTEVDASHLSMLNELRETKGADFTKLYHKDQDKGHKEAVSLFERYGKSGDNAELKAWANKTLPTLQDHYKMAQNLDK